MFETMPNIARSLITYTDVSVLVLRGVTLGSTNPLNAKIRVREHALTDEETKELDNMDASYAGEIAIGNDVLHVYLSADVGTIPNLLCGSSDNTRCELDLTIGRILDTERAWIQNFELSLYGETADYKTHIDFVDDDELEVPDAERHWDVIRKLSTIERMIFWIFMILVFVAVIVFFK